MASPAFIGKLSIAGLMLFVLTQAAGRYGRYKHISVATSAVSDKKMDNRKRLWLLRGAIILLALAALVGWWLIPGVRSFVQHSFSAFATLDQQALERFYLRLWSAGSPGLFRADDPAGDCRAAAGIFLITFANASLFGALWGGVLSSGQRDGWRGVVLFLLPAYWAVKW